MISHLLLFCLFTGAFSSLEWRQVQYSPPRLVLSSHSAVTTPNGALIYGGLEPSGELSNKILRYDASKLFLEIYLTIRTRNFHFRFKQEPKQNGAQSLLFTSS